MSDVASKISGEDHEPARGAELLLLATVLQRYCAADQEDVALDVLEVLQSASRLQYTNIIIKECIDGASRMFSDKKSKKARKGVTDDADMSFEPVDVFVDTIIGFLEKSTAYMRTVGNQVFALLSGSVTDTTIDLIVTVRTHLLPYIPCSTIYSNWRGVP